MTLDRAARIGNCSGFYGDRISAMREMLEGGPLDYLTGDYLAELTMLILGKDTLRDPSTGYAKTFLRQCEDALGLALERGVRVVANAGGMNPAGLTVKVREVAHGLGLDVAVAHVEGDDLRAKAAALGFDNALTANAYLGGFGIKSALDAGAQVVVTGRVTDASVVLGAAAHAHDWSPADHDALAGAVIAGHVIECGNQACGGNFSGFLDLPAGSLDAPLGFPIAEVAADGATVITKHPGTGGAVTLDTVTAQLVYEIQSGTYLNPDVSVDLTSVRLHQQGPDRVAIDRVTGSAPPETLKVCVNELGGYRNQMDFLLTGLNVREKGEWIKRQIIRAWGDRAPQTTEWTPVPELAADPADMAQASTVLRVTCLDTDQVRAGKGFTAPAVELALGSYPGFTMSGPPAKPSPYGIYTPYYVARSEVEHTVVHADGRREVIDDPTDLSPGGAAAVTDDARWQGAGYAEPDDGTAGPLGLVPLRARSGDKGGNANLGVWVPRDGVGERPADLERHRARVEWLMDFMTPDRVRQLLPEAADLDIDVYALPQLGGVNVVIHGLLGAGVAAATRIDPQAKAVGEWFLARYVTLREDLR